MLKVSGFFSDQKMRLTKGLDTSSSITVPFTAEKPRNLHGSR
jgi:hypothetical protein